MLKTRKVRNQELWDVFDSVTGQVVCRCDSLRDATNIVVAARVESENPRKIGGAISGAALKNIFKKTYNKSKVGDVPGYSIDKELSGRRVKTYVNDATGEVVVGIRGTSGFQDVMTDAKLFFTPTKKLKELKRFKHADGVLKGAEKKYGKENITVAGHSLGARIAEVIGGADNKNIITYNKPVIPFKRNVDKANQIDIKTSRDPVSMLDHPDGNDIVLKSKTLNPLYEHSTDALDKYLDDDVMIGRGLSKRKSTKKVNAKIDTKSKHFTKDGVKYIRL